MGGAFTHRLGCFDSGGGAPVAVDEPNYYRTAILIDATGQSDGTGYVADESRHAHALTYNGNAQITSGRFEFDGTGDYIDAPHSILWTPGHKFTMEISALEFDAVNTGTSQTVAAQYAVSGNQISWIINEQAGSLVFSWSTSGNATTNSITIGTVTTGTPYDVAIVWDGATVYAYLDGVKSGDTEAFTGMFFDSNQTLRFGANGAAAEFLNGRFTAFAFTRGEVLYTAASHTVPSLPRTLDSPSLTDSEWANVIALVTYDSTLSRIVDAGPLDLPLIPQNSIVGTTGTTLADGTPSIEFNGSTYYLQTSADDPLLELAGGSYTIEQFVRHSDNNALRTYISKYSTVGANRSWWLRYRGDAATDIFELIRSNNGTGTTSPVQSAAWTPTTSTWYHVAMSGDGTNHRLFVDGTQSGSTNTTAVTLQNSTAAIVWGADGNLTTWMSGHMTEMRLTKAARYTSNFTGPTGAFPRG